MGNNPAKEPYILLMNFLACYFLFFFAFLINFKLNLMLSYFSINIVSTQNGGSAGLEDNEQGQSVV